MSSEQARAVDEICDCFEHQLYTGTGPPIEKLLTGFREPVRSVLLYELLVLEIEHLLADQVRVDPDMYRQRFPSDPDVIGDALAEFSLLLPSMSATRQETFPKIPNYQVLRKLSEGGMGAVYEAMHTKLGNLVAIKLLRKELVSDLSAVIRFEREMRVIGTLTHPNIVAARDAGRSDGTHYLVMEYVVGMDLADLVNHHGPLEVADACEISRRIALALEQAHRHNLVHRDIKPKNILIGRTNDMAESLEVKVADFGLALLRGHPKPTDSNVPGEIVGTFSFMAPEQFWLQRSDIRSDIYSLGCTLHFLLTGSPPFSREFFSSTRQLMEAHREAPPPTIDRIDGQPLQQLLAKLLAKHPDDRPRSPSEVANALLHFCRGHRLDSILSLRRTPSNHVVEPTETQSLNDNSSHVSSDPATDSTPKLDDLTVENASPTRGSESTMREFRERHTDETGLDTTTRSTFARTWLVRPAWGISVGLAASLALLVLFWRSPPATQPTIKDLLANIHLDRDTLAGTWQHDERGVLVSPDETRALIALTTDIPQAYRLEVEASRRSGGRMVVGLVHDGNQYPIELDAAMVAGHRSTLGMEPSTHLSKAKKLGFLGGAANTYTCLVRPDGVVIAWQDHIHMMLTPAELKQVANSSWRPNHFSGIFIGTQGSIYEFKRITLQSLVWTAGD